MNMFSSFPPAYERLPDASTSLPTGGTTDPTKAHPTLSTLSCLARVIRIIFSSEQENVRSLYFLLILCSVLYQIFVYYIGIAIPKFYIVLNAKDEAAFWSLVGRLVGLYLAISTAKASLHFVGGLFALRTRRILTRKLQEGYVTKGALYDVARSKADGIDNPDQRITQDVEKFSDESRKVMEEIVIEPALLVYYTYQTYLVSGWQGPSMIYLYFTVSLVVCRYLLRPLVSLVYSKQRAEGDFRFLHVRLRSNAEPVAFLRGEELERGVLEEAFQNLLGLMRKIVHWEAILRFGTSYCNYFGSVVCYGIIAMPIFDGVYDDLSPGELSALISTNLFFSLYLSYRFTAIAELAEKYADLAGYAARMGQFFEVIDREKLTASTMGNYAVTTTTNDADPYISIRDLSYNVPQGQSLVSNLTLTVTPGSHLLIMGPSGSGKSSLLRVLSGLWVPYQGQMSLPPENKMLFLPQIPYLVHGGTLLEQIIYPAKLEEVYIPDEDVEVVLRTVGLEHLLLRERDVVMAGKDLDWDVMLSPGERQRLAFARALWRRPIFAFLDEATCNIDAAAEGELFKIAWEKGITCVLVSHRIVHGFGRVLRIVGDGTWVEESLD
ncbi:uncharacterized protein SPPG_03987 [Spizellomyces punctatus DAOM BR117]|uniref:ABC transporter domain-containing protein n=1 Tax=Spizellomyces punctatus (strain DAOM BR117) TaxID=645134 RepID=A0A0L0HID1_SPIPD|nr:uncharacterized protein SPPG_03987 [Spizellomyces punctatus DAOM BR117]KND00887.1 hypothetical protein SPPG_03987 [Spizellomyces punctatus DAOM BR117]|eukprot:XP_016608926.1 hypothetical protein SPPG_03987 [Spizellomyces punctatus DAOM BR117]